MAVLRYARALFESFYSARFYRAVRHEWRGAGIIYLLFLSLIAQLPTAVKSTWELHQWNLDHRGQAFLQRIPEFRTEGGQLITEVETPYEIKDPETGRAAIILDPESTIDVSELPPGVFVLGEREVMIRNTQGQLRSVPYESWGDLTFNREKIGKWVKVVTLVGVPLVFLLMAFFFFAWRVLLSAMLAGVFVRYARRIPQPFRFADRVRLCAVALTPAVLIGTAVEWLPARLAYFWVIRAIVVGTYAFYALRANVQPPEVAVAAIQGSSPATPPS